MYCTRTYLEHFLFYCVVFPSTWVEEDLCVIESCPPSREATTQSFDCRKEIPYIMYPMSFVPHWVLACTSMSLPVPLRLFAGMASSYPQFLLQGWPASAGSPTGKGRRHFDEREKKGEACGCSFLLANNSVHTLLQTLYSPSSSYSAR